MPVAPRRIMSSYASWNAPMEGAEVVGVTGLVVSFL